MLGFFTALGISERVARILIPVLVVILFYLALNAYGDARYDAGKDASDLAWREAAARLEEQSREAGEYADRASSDRAADYAKAVAREKEKIDEAIDTDGDPLDVLF